MAELSPAQQAAQQAVAGSGEYIVTPSSETYTVYGNPPQPVFNAYREGAAIAAHQGHVARNTTLREEEIHNGTTLTASQLRDYQDLLRQFTAIQDSGNAVSARQSFLRALGNTHDDAVLGRLAYHAMHYKNPNLLADVMQAGFKGREALFTDANGVNRPLLTDKHHPKLAGILNTGMITADNEVSDIPPWDKEFVERYTAQSARVRAELNPPQKKHTPPPRER